MMKSYMISIIMSIFLITILNFVLNRNSNKFKKKVEWQHYFFGYLFMLYLMIALKDVVGFPSLSEWRRLLAANSPIFNPIINLVPFNDGLEISAILNIIFFMPFGFLLPTLWEKYRTLLPTLFTGILFSIIIEIGQLFIPFRASDINDLIMNSIGTIFGWIIFNIMSKIFYKLSNKIVVESASNDSIIIKLESCLYIIISIISTFLS